MQRITLSIFTGFAICAFAIQGAPAASGSANFMVASSIAASAGSQYASAPGPKSGAGGSGHGSSGAQHKTYRDKPSPPAKPVATRKPSSKASAADQKAAAREQAESEARADRMYQSSQFSAPIIIDAKACKRTGVNGESIYENC